MIPSKEWIIEEWKQWLSEIDMSRMNLLSWTLICGCMFLFYAAPILSHSRKIHLSLGVCVGILVTLIFCLKYAWPKSPTTQITYVIGILIAWIFGPPKEWWEPFVEDNSIWIAIIFFIGSIAGFSFVYLYPLSEKIQTLTSISVRILSLGVIAVIIHFQMFRLNLFRALVLVLGGFLCYVLWYFRFLYFVRWQRTSFGEEFLSDNQQHSQTLARIPIRMTTRDYNHETSITTQRELQKLWKTFGQNKEKYQKNLQPTTFAAMNEHWEIQQRVERNN